MSPKGLTEAQITEIAKSELKTRILLTINHPTEVIRIIENESLALFTLAGLDYVGAMVKRGEIESSKDGIVEKVNITISNVNQSISQIVASEGDTLTNVACTLEEIIFNGFPADWQASTAYTTGSDPAVNYVSSVVKNSYIYQCTTAGTSGETEPTWTTTIGNTVNDGTVVWTCRSPIIGDPIELFSGLINNVHLNALEFKFDIERQLGGHSVMSPNLTYDINCQYTFKDERCGYSGAGSSCGKTFTDCQAYSNETRFGGFPSIPKAMVIKV